MRPIRKAFAAAAFCALAAFSLPATAQQIETVDPDAMIDADLNNPPATTGADPWQNTDGTSQAQGSAYEGAYDVAPPSSRYDANPSLDLPPEEIPAQGTGVETAQAQPAAHDGKTYAEDDLIGAAEGLFGRGAEGLARVIQDVLSDQGEPNGYIVGREGGGAFVLGVRYGSGTLHHAVEGNMPVYWTGPSIGFDAGANAGNTFVLVYNLYDTDELYERFPAGEGQAYFVGGFTASYVRKGDIVLIPIRVGAGLRLGVNAGYMRFSRKQRWLPF
ncbi:DUF1134 domain-containing protein [Aurantiacibacter rhizosphaerae]|uniref:DUF1134 domain-containing protein n=1 Tax=Aurantiacibacter rhizosphaerae TaxID=2691582 RepID=A0A844XER1_9SPHN|nr:DUF1134 domain-containing protein [Aurantiacibacter rhizosphaerae]MWV29071.1 DUF1134 domain-containing protein [Aurantiacibacter rhizosphaerae]